MGTYENFITDSLSGVLELTEPHMLQRRFTAINLTKLEDQVTTPDAEKSKDKAANKIKSSLGSLNILPPEIIIMVIRAMEFRSVAAFRNVNTYAREMADTRTKFGAVKDHAPFVLRAAINLNPPLPASVARLDASLLDDTCSCCGIRDGSIISLLDCLRYCDTCFPWNGDQDQCIWCFGDTNG